MRPVRPCLKFPQNPRIEVEEVEEVKEVEEKTILYSGSPSAASRELEAASAWATLRPKRLQIKE